MKQGDSASVSVASVMWTYKGELNSTSRKNWKELSTSTISTDVSFNVDSSEETVLPHSTTRHHKYWTNQTICQAKPIKFIINLYTNHNTLWVKHVKHQKVESSKSSFSFKVRKHGQQQLYLQCKVCWVLYKRVGAFFHFHNPAQSIQN